MTNSIFAGRQKLQTFFELGKILLKWGRESTKILVLLVAVFTLCIKKGEAGRILATTPTVGKANAKQFMVSYGQLVIGIGLQQREAVRRTGTISSSGSPLREEPEQRGYNGAAESSSRDSDRTYGIVGSYVSGFVHNGQHIAQMVCQFKLFLAWHML